MTEHNRVALRLFFVSGKQEQVMIIKNAELHTLDATNRIINNGWVFISDGRIVSVGTSDENIPSDSEVIDAGGHPVYPGFVDAHTHLGLFGDSLTFEGDDGNEDTDPIMPQLRAIDGADPLDRYFSEALRAGITTVLTSPGSANPIAGQIAALKTYGKRIDKMIVKFPAGIKFALGENPKSTYNDKEQSPVTRMATAALIREALIKGRKYFRDKMNAEKDPENFDEPEFDVKSDALLPLFKKEVPAHFHVHRADDIFTAIRIADEFDLDYILVHATDAYLVFDELVGERLKGVLSGPILTDRSKPELKNQNPKAPGILSQNGIPTAIITDHPETPIQYLLLCAAVAVRSGMDREDALRAVTITPARICGIDNRVGSIEPGKDADLVIYSGAPLDITQKPLRVIVEGKTCFCDNV